MIYILKKNMRLKNRAFTLAEAIFSIFISILVIFILQNLLVNLKTANKSSHRSDNIVFTYVQFNRFLQEDSSITYLLPESSNSIRVKFVKETSSGKKKAKTIYVLEKYKDMIRTTTASGGHMPLLLNIRDANFATQDRQLKVNVIENDGRRSELYFKFDPKPKEDEKKSKKIKTKDKNDNTKSKRTIK